MHAAKLKYTIILYERASGRLFLLARIVRIENVSKGVAGTEEWNIYIYIRD